MHNLLKPEYSIFLNNFENRVQNSILTIEYLNACKINCIYLILHLNYKSKLYLLNI